MELPDLSRDERLACVTLIQHIIMADSEVSEVELKYIDRLAAAFGKDAYRELLDESAAHLRSEDAVKALLEGITQQPARNLILETVMECAFEEGISAPEVELMHWLQETWNV